MACMSCAERRRLISQGLNQAKQGNGSALAQTVRQFGQTINQDVGSLRRAAAQAAMARLGRR